MEPATYAAEAAAEQTHWWFVGRRVLFRRLIERFVSDRSARVLDVGTSTGTNLRMLTEMGFVDVTGLDMSEDAIRFCADKGLPPVRQGDITAMPFEADRFSLVLATDVVEHVDDDAQAVAEIERVLVPGGIALFTVPAFQSLWGLQDEVSHHKRRYRRAGFRNLVEGSGLEIVDQFYFNYLLFAPIWLARRLLRLVGPQMRSEADLNPPFVNALLLPLMRFDVTTAPLVRPPFGVSYLVIARKRSGR
jgi:SAM-dependent methyltransferase